MRATCLTADLEAQVRALLARVVGMTLEAGEPVENINITKARAMTARPSLSG